MLSDEVMITKKTYLAKVKRADDYNSEDEVWVICQAGNDNIDHEDFKNIVEVLNEKGLWTPILSKENATWGAIKNSAECKALKYVGDPLMLLERVHTFKEVLVFLYSVGILTNPQGREILDGKIEEAKQRVQKKRKSTTIEASAAPKVVKTAEKVLPKAVLQYAMENAAALTAQANATSASDLGFSEAAQQLSNVAECSQGFKFPAPVPVTQGLAYPSGSLQSCHKSLVTEVLDSSSSSPAVTTFTGHQHQVVSIFDLESMGSSSSAGTGPDILASSVEVITTPGDSNGASGEIGRGGAQESLNDLLHDFDPSQFNIDEVDNIIEGLEADAEGDLRTKVGRYQSLAKTLRKSLEFACTTNQNLLRVVDANELKLCDYQAYSASEVLEGLQPAMSNLGMLMTKLDKVLEVVRTLDEKYTEKLSSLRVEIGELSAAIVNNAVKSGEHSDNIVRHLGTFGMIDVGSTFDIPNAIQSIYKMLSEDIAPVFQSSLVEAVSGEPPIVGPPAGGHNGPHPALPVVAPHQAHTLAKAIPSDVTLAVTPSHTASNQLGSYPGAYSTVSPATYPAAYPAIVS